MVTDFSHHPFDMFISIDFRYEKILVKSRYAFEFVETIKFFAVICLALTALIALIAFVPNYVGDDEYTAVGVNATYNYEKIKSIT